MSVAHISNAPRFVSEIMSSQVLSVELSDTLWDAWQMMFVSGHRHLAVTSGSRCVGIINDRSILSSVIVTEARLALHRVADVMNISNNNAVSPDTDIQTAADLMTQLQVNALPVVDAGEKLVGIVTSTDVIGWISNNTAH